MSKSRSTNAATALLALVACLGGVLACRARAADEKKPTGPIFSGTVQAVSAEKGTLTVLMPTGKGKETEEKSVPLAKDLRILINDSLSKEQPPAVGKLADLTEGTIVTVQLGEDRKTAVLVVANGPGLHGSVKEVDAGAGKFVVAVKGKGGVEEHALTLAPGAKVLLNDGLKKGQADKEGRLGDLLAGQPVLVALTVDRKRAIGVRPQGRAVQGTLKGLDAGAGTVVVTVKEDGNLVDKTFALVEGARIDGDPQAGAAVAVRLSVFDDKKAVEVRALGK